MAVHIRPLQLHIINMEIKTCDLITAGCCERRARKRRPTPQPLLTRRRRRMYDSPGSAKGPQRSVASRRLNSSIGGVPVTFPLASSAKNGSIGRTFVSHGPLFFSIESSPFAISAMKSPSPATFIENQTLNQAPEPTPLYSSPSTPCTVFGVAQLSSEVNPPT
jgi:hypothetical protein